MLNNKIVGLDLDGVIIDHTANKIRLAAQYGYVLTPLETHAERMGDMLPEEVYRSIKSELYNQTDGADASPLMTGAYTGLATLKENGIPFYLISLQQNPMFAQHLVEIHGLWGNYFTPENIYFARNGHQKSRIASDLGVTHFVDDEVNILELMETVSRRVLFDAFNQYPKRDNLFSVTNWGQLTEFLLQDN